MALRIIIIFKLLFECGKTGKRPRFCVAHGFFARLGHPDRLNLSFNLTWIWWQSERQFFLHHRGGIYPSAKRLYTVILRHFGFGRVCFNVIAHESAQDIRINPRCDRFQRGNAGLDHRGAKTRSELPIPVAQRVQRTLEREFAQPAEVKFVGQSRQSGGIRAQQKRRWRALGQACNAQSGDTLGRR